jgi:hypothetical protein
MLSKPVFILYQNINWTGFSSNTHPFAILILEENLDKLHFTNVCGNPEAVHIINLFSKIKYKKQRT